MIAWVSMAWAQSTPCPQTVAEADLRLQATRAMTAFAELASDELRSEAAAVERDAACLQRPIPADLAARVHLVLAARTWLLDRQGPWIGHLCGIQRLDPSFELSPELFAPDHRMRIAFDNASCDDLKEVTLQGAWADGRTSLPKTPVPFPYLAQRERRGRTEGRWVAMGEPFPYEGPSTQSSAPPVLAAGGAATALVGSVLLAVSVGRAGRYTCLLDPPAQRRVDCVTTLAEAEALRSSLRPLNAVGWTLLSTGTAVGGAGVVVTWRQR